MVWLTLFWWFDSLLYSDMAQTPIIAATHRVFMTAAQPSSTAMKNTWVVSVVANPPRVHR